MCCVVIDVPIRTSGSNAREHHFQRHRRVKMERSNVGWVLCGKRKPTLPCVVLLTRLTPSYQGLDDDNLRTALKATRDEVAAWIGVNDADQRVKWDYAEERGHPWGVTIVIRWEDGGSQ